MIKALNEGHRIEMKSYVQHISQLSTSVQNLKVSAAYIHLTALLLGGVVCLCITGPSA
jgi:hypothetical protein